MGEKEQLTRVSCLGRGKLNWRRVGELRLIRILR